MRTGMLLLILLSLILPALAENGLGMFYWRGPADDGGTGLRYAHIEDSWSFELNWGYRWPAPDEAIGTVRALIAAPVVQWPRGAISVGPAVTWYWVAEARPGLEDALFDPQHDTLLETLLGLAVYATLDAATSPFASAGQDGHGVKIRPSIGLRQALTDGLYVDVSYDIGHGSQDLFQGANMSLTFTGAF